MYKIFIVEDDVAISMVMENYLNRWGYQAKCVEDFSNVLSEFAAFSPALVLMDISLPFFNGYHWCNEIRKISKIPIIFLSSMSDHMNIVMAMNMGGDDFITKPFEMDVLVAKIQALLRRTYEFGASVNFLEHKGAILNLQDGTLNYNGKVLDLTKNEFRILSLLMERKNQIVSRDVLMEKLWETDCYVDENTLTVNITRLRKHLEEIGIKNFIQTKKGMGYYLE